MSRWRCPVKPGMTMFASMTLYKKRTFECYLEGLWVFKAPRLVQGVWIRIPF